MKKALIGIAGIMVMAVVIVLFINAREGDKVAKKATTEMKSDCGNCPAATACEQKAVTEVKECDPATCPEHTAAALKEMKDCDPAACPAHMSAAMKEMKPCCPEAVKASATK